MDISSCCFRLYLTPVFWLNTTFALGLRCFRNHSVLDWDIVTIDIIQTLKYCGGTGNGRIVSGLSLGLGNSSEWAYCTGALYHCQLTCHTAKMFRTLSHTHCVCPSYTHVRAHWSGKPHTSHFSLVHRFNLLLFDANTNSSSLLEVVSDTDT